MNRPPVEPLEPRQLCAAAPSGAVAVLRGQTLTITGAPKAANTIVVGLSPDLSQVVVNDTWYTGQGAKAKGHTLAKSFPVTASISLVAIKGGNRADRITIDETYSRFPIGTHIDAGNGNDTVVGGDEPDTIFGGNGNDLLIGGGGNDSIRGQGGNDTLLGGDGNDFLAGRRGRDSMDGGAGDDTLHDPFGPDTLVGGPGNDTFEIHSLKTDKHNDYYSAEDQLHIISIPGPSDNSDDDGFLGTLFPILSSL